MTRLFTTAGDRAKALGIWGAVAVAGVVPPIVARLGIRPVRAGSLVEARG